MWHVGTEKFSRHCICGSICKVNTIEMHMKCGLPSFAHTRIVCLLQSLSLVQTHLIQRMEMDVLTRVNMVIHNQKILRSGLHRCSRN